MAYESLMAFVLALGILTMIAQLVLAVLRTLAIFKIRDKLIPKPIKEDNKAKMAKLFPKKEDKAEEDNKNHPKV